MKKCINLIYLVLISSSLNAMIRIPDVTKWQEICKNPEEKQQLITVYKDFCQKRIKDNIAWTVGSFAPFIFKSVRQNQARCGLIGLFAMRQAYLLGRNMYRNQLAIQEDLSYLNHDVLEQLGNPDAWNSQHGFYVMFYDYDYENRFTKKTGRELVRHEDWWLSVNDVNGIKKALSGNYYYKVDYYAETYLKMKTKVKLTIKEIRDKLE